MRDNGDDSVTVRLYKVDETDSKNHTFDEQYFKVEKSVPKDTTGPGGLQRGRALGADDREGVRGRRLHGARTRRRRRRCRTRGSRRPFAARDGGAHRRAGAAYLLTGGGGAERASNDDYCTRGLSTRHQGSTVDDGDHAGRTCRGTSTRSTTTRPRRRPTTTPTCMSFKILKDKGKVDTWITFVKTDEIKDMFVARDTDRGTGYAVQITLADFDAAFKTGSLDAGVAATMLAWIESQKLYPGALGTAQVLVRVQLDVFAKIKETLDKGGEVTGGDAGVADEGRRPGRRRERRRGGAARHGRRPRLHVPRLPRERAARTRPTADGGRLLLGEDPQPVGQLRAQVRLLEGRDAAGEEVKDGDGVSWLELSDLTKFFETVSFQ